MSTGAKVGIGFGIFFGVILLAYLIGVVVFMGRVFPNTTLGNQDISLMSAEDLRAQLNSSAENYKLSVTSSNGYSQTITAADIDLENSNGSSMAEMVPGHNAFAWPVEIFKSHDVSDGVKISYNQSQVDQLVSSAVDTYNASAVMPVNASLSYSTTTNSFSILSEVTGTALDKSLVSMGVKQAIEKMSSTLVLDGTYQLKPTILSTDARLTTGLQAAQKMVAADVTYTLGGTAVTELNADVIGPMIKLDDNFTPQLDSDQLNAWATEIADSLCTVGSTRTYTRADGKVITVSGGVYGWSVDAETFANQVKADAAEGATKTVAIECESEGNGFTAIGAADWGARYIDVDLSEQHVRFYDATGIIWEADCVSGSTLTAGRATPQGVWEVNGKESPSTLIGYKANGEKEYETKVTYWMPFEGNGVGFHDATWQPGFGGNLYQQGYGSHGCINLSYSAAESLYSIITWGDVVVVHE